MRVTAVLLLVGVAVTHLAQARAEDAPYVIFLFVALALTSLGIAALLAAGRPVLPAAAALCAVTVVGYVASRTIGLPQMADDVGNWGEPLGIAALACELGVIALALHDAPEIVKRLVGFPLGGPLERAVRDERAERAAG